MATSELLDTRLLLVTGKGGVGKSSVAAALALAGSRTGRRTCLVEVERRQSMAQLFRTGPWDFTEREFRPGLHGMSIDPEDSLLQYLEQFYGARRLSRMLVGTSAVEFVTTTAPGISDVLLIGKVKEMERRRDRDGRRHYDLIVVDAPPTGRIVNFLRAPEATTELINMGPVRAQAQSVVDMLLDGNRTHVQLVTLLEEMPVAETVDSAAALRALGVTLGPVLVNRVQDDPFDDAARKAFTDTLDTDAIAAVSAGTGLDLEPPTVAALQARGEWQLQRLTLQERMREQLRGRLGLPLIELPYLAGTEFGEAEVSALAERLESHA